MRSVVLTLALTLCLGLASACDCDQYTQTYEECVGASFDGGLDGGPRECWQQCPCEFPTDPGTVCVECKDANGCP